MAGFVVKKLNELHQFTENAIVIALVITKTEPNYFLSKKSKDFRGVITFTLRDSKANLCNCKFWGSKETVEEYNRTMKIGDIISVKCPTVEYCSNSLLTENNYTPRGTLSIMLVINEGTGSLALYDYRNIEVWNNLQSLMSISHKPLSSVLTLTDVRNSAVANMKTLFVDLLVMIGEIGNVKDIFCNSKTVQCLEVIVFDRNSSIGMVFNIWHNDWIKRAQQFWQPMKTVLHLIEVSVAYSSYHKSCILKHAKRTVIYENPLGNESDELRAYALTNNVNLILNAHNGNYLPNPEDINTQMTVKQIYMRAEGHLSDEAEEFTAVLYAMVTKFDIDGYGHLVGRKCKVCHRIMSSGSSICEYNNCTATNSNGIQYEQFFNINIHFADHTGTLVETRLTNTIAENLLQMSANDFTRNDETKNQQLENIKWIYLLNHVEVKFLIKKPNASRRQLSILVVNMRRIEGLNEMAKKIMVF